MIKINDKFKNINFSNKKDEKVINFLKRINSKVEEVKIKLPNSFEL